MCTTIHITEAAATSASGPSRNSWFDALNSRYPAATLMARCDDDAPVHGGGQMLTAGLSEVRQADCDNRKASSPSRNVMTNA